MTTAAERLSAAIHLESAAIAPRTSPLIEAAKEVLAENERLRRLLDATMGSFAIHADRYQRDFGLNGLHPVHYEVLQECGSRMDDFKRATNADTAYQQLTPQKE